jgi:hypothetical protein
MRSPDRIKLVEPEYVVVALDDGFYSLCRGRKL